ncbi:hypothetical protein J6590_008986 [Homalodisca vitripennis]|nr:hypothetical protein J6590_008986 [Homalodisca vitripennis]
MERSEYGTFRVISSRYRIAEPNVSNVAVETTSVEDTCVICASREHCPLPSLGPDTPPKVEAVNRGRTTPLGPGDTIITEGINILITAIL